MLRAILKKRVSDDTIANILINVIVEAVDVSFPEIALFIDEDQAFVKVPGIAYKSSEHFLNIVLSANLSLVQSTFETGHAADIERALLQKMARIYDMPLVNYAKQLKEYQSFMHHINQPSKNMVYGMSKAIFAKYELHKFQDEYFKGLRAPNPMFIKRLNQISELFLWDWDAFFTRYKL